MPSHYHCTVFASPLLTAAVSPTPSSFTTQSILSITTPSATLTVVPIHSSTPTSTHQRYRKCKCLPYRLINLIHLINGTNTTNTTTTQPTPTRQHRPRAPPLHHHLQRPRNCLQETDQSSPEKSFPRQPKLASTQASSSLRWDYVGLSSASARVPRHILLLPPMWVRAGV